MSLTEDDVFLVFLEKGDDPLTHYAISQALGADPNDSENGVGRLVHAMVQAGIIAEFDIEQDALDGVLVEHEQYGSLDNDELTFIEVDNVFFIGPRSFDFVDERKSQLIERAIDRGLDKAVEMLRDLRIDSSSWNGLPAGFAFTPEVQAKVIRLLQNAIDALDRSRLGNRAKAQAGAYLRCALLLAEAPDPEPDLIAELLQRLRLFGEAVSLVSGLAGLYAMFGFKA